MASQSEANAELTSFQGGLKSEDLKGYIRRIEKLEQDKKNTQEDIKAVKAEAKSAGFNPKIITTIVKIRARDENEVAEEELLIDLYKRALGMPTD